MAGAAGTYEAHGHHRAPFPVLIDEFTSGEGSAMHKQAGAHIGLGLTQVHVLSDEPFRELPGVDAGWRGGRIL